MSTPNCRCHSCYPRKTPADVLRKAATLMREQHGPEHERHEMWTAMADWLESLARRSRFLTLAPLPNSKEWEHGFAVARAYLEAAS